MLRTIHLHGEMRSRFGGPYQLDVASAAEAAKALGAQIPGFKRYVLEHDFRIVRTAAPERQSDLGADELMLALGRTTDLAFIPVVAGSGGNGRNVAKIVGGLTIAAVAWWAAPTAIAGASASGMGTAIVSVGGMSLTYGNIAGFGLIMALSGASNLLSKPASKSSGKASLLYSGAQNVTEEGGAIPWIWGTRVRVGSTVISSGVSSEDIGLYD